MLFAEMAMMEQWEGRGLEGGSDRIGSPCLRDDDVVEGLITLAEAGEPYFEDHARW